MSDDESKTFLDRWVNQLAVFPHGHSAMERLLVHRGWLACREEVRTILLDMGESSLHPHIRAALDRIDRL